MRLAVILLCAFSRIASAQPISPSPKPAAARSVHLRWAAPPAVLFYNEAFVQESVPGSYFVAAGWDRGYFGLQEHAAKDMVLFSVWDPPHGDRPEAVPREDRVEVLYADPASRVQRFGGEGTGQQCKYPYAWKTGEKYRFLVQAQAQGRKTDYIAWFYRNDQRRWVKLAAFRALTHGAPLRDYYSFVEDFRRDGKSVTERRRARFGPVWVRTADGAWKPAKDAHFTADNTHLLNIDATAQGPALTLATGGDVLNTTKLDTRLKVADPGKPPQDLP